MGAGTFRPVGGCVWQSDYGGGGLGRPPNVLQTSHIWHKCQLQRKSIAVNKGLEELYLPISDNGSQGWHQQ